MLSLATVRLSIQYRLTRFLSPWAIHGSKGLIVSPLLGRESGKVILDNTNRLCTPKRFRDWVRKKGLLHINDTGKGIPQDDSLSRLGLTVCDQMQALDFDKASDISKRSRFCDASPGLAAVTRFVFMQQESTKLVVEALERSGNHGLNTEELLREAARINEPLATGLFLTDPRDVEKLSIPSSAFTPSFTFQFKQTLWHSGVLSTPIHKTAGKGASVYEHKHDYWKLQERSLIDGCAAS